VGPVGPDADGRAANLSWWQEATPLHEGSDLYDLAGFRAGRDPLRPFEVAELGDVTGLDLLHLQCHLGTDSLAWARRGARVVGLDFSSNAVDAATRLARDCHLDAEFVCADVYDAAEALAGRRFDVVYTGVGALNWLPDLARWAVVVDELLRPGGVLYVAEIHPIVLGMDDDGRQLVRDVVHGDFAAWDHPGGTYAVPDVALVNTVTFERVWSLSEVFAAVRQAGLDIELLREHSYTNAPWPWAVRGDDGFFRLPAGWPKYPLAYTVRARKPPAGDEPPGGA
jgi:2-polyprenyl-3-methyl-5-hydroxy-6-metoxy-1,4-benzoquinol methylase